MKKIIFSISGGVGKNIMATSVIRELKPKYKESEIYIHSPYPDVWQNNPLVHKIIGINEPLYPYCNDMDTESFLLEPYATTDFAYQNKHLTEIWGDLCNVKISNHLPELYLDKEELEKVKKIFEPIKKPIFMIQTSGGAPNQAFPISWTRDLPLHIAQEVVDKMIIKGYEVFHIRRADQYPLRNVSTLTLPPRELFASISFSHTRLFIDSMPQHIAGALGKKSVVVWVGNNPKVFGYEIHDNIISKSTTEFRHLPNSYTDKWNITGAIEECPYDDNNLFDADNLVERLILNSDL